VTASSSSGFERLVLRLLTDVLHRPVVVRSIAPKGYRSEWAGVVAVGDGVDSMFVKARSGPGPVAVLNHERGVLERLPAGLAPAVRSWCYSPMDEIAVLALEDLSANRWPPPWSAESIGETIALLSRITAVDLAIDTLPRLVDIVSRLGNWTTIASDPAPFLTVGLRSARWLDRVLPFMLEMNFSEALDGEQLTHFDVRSDNICFGRAGPVLVDWEDSCLGNARIDLLSWLPSLRMEGGPEPWLLAPDAELELIAFLAGYWSSQAGMPEPPGAPGLRRLQRAQASVALDWLDIRLSPRSPRQVEHRASELGVFESGHHRDDLGYRLR
jgi:Phosphotransferase enzyme family